MKPLRESIEQEQKAKNEAFEEKLTALSELLEEQNEVYDRRFKTIQRDMGTSITTTLNNVLDAYFNNKKTPSGIETSSHGAEK